MATDDPEQIAALRERINELEARIQFLYKHLGVTYVYEAAAGDDSRVIAAIQKGGVIEGIRVYREIYKAGLAEAKAAVEDLQGRLSK